MKFNIDLSLLLLGFVVVVGTVTLCGTVFANDYARDVSRSDPFAAIAVSIVGIVMLARFARVSIRALLRSNA